MFKKLLAIGSFFLFILLAVISFQSSFFKFPLLSQKQKFTHSNHIPLLAQSALSSTLGKDQSAYYFSSTGQGYTNHHPTQKYEIHLNPEGLKVAQGSQDWGLSLSGLGNPDHLQKISAPVLEVKKNRVEYRYFSHHPQSNPDIIVWYENGPLGLEQGFTISSPPSSSQHSQKLILQLDQLGNSLSELKEQQLQIKNPQGKTLFRYAGLVAYDAKGKKLPAEMKLQSSQLLLAVDTQKATYPITIDPFIQTAELTSSDGAAGDEFSTSVSIDGSTIVVGAPFVDLNGHVNQGASYVFVESNGSWNQTQKLTASDGAADDDFGVSVFIDGSTIVVGAPFADVNGHADQGAVYVFIESNGSWSQTQKLVSSNGIAEDKFGYALYMDGSTLAITAPLADVNGHADQGAAYVFTKSNESWTQTQELTSSDGATEDQFGTSVSLDQSTMVIGAPFADVNGHDAQGAAYVFTRANGTWSQTQKLFSNGVAGDQFGFAVSLYGSTIVVGAELADVEGHVDQGAAYVFTESNGTWSQTQQLSGNDTIAGDEFGWALFVYGSTLSVGAPFVQIDGATNAGATYVFTESDRSWTQTQKLISTDVATNQFFGAVVFIDESTMAISAATDVDGKVRQGAEYIFQVPAVQVDPTSLSLVSSGNSGSYTLTLTVQPTSDVIVTAHPPSGLILNNNIFTFTSSNWFIPQTVQVTASQSALGSLTISHTAASDDSNYNGITISNVAVLVTPPGGCAMVNAHFVGMIQLLTYFLAVGILFFFRKIRWSE